MPADPWEAVRRAVDSFYERAIGAIEEYSSSGRIGAPVNVFFYSVGGRRLAVLSRFERILTTMLGDHCLSFLAPFLASTSPAPRPWTARVGLRSGWSGYVRVVPARNTVNSSLRRELVRSYRSLGAPAAVLTIQGEDFETIELTAGLRWYGPTDTWSMVTGDRGAYSRFRRIVLEVGRAYRRRLLAAAERLAGGRRRSLAPDDPSVF